MTRGVTFPTITLQFLTGSGPFDLTGYTAQSQVRVQPSDPVVLDLAPIITDAVNGFIDLSSFTDEETMLLVAGVYQWDFLLVTATNEVFGRYIFGQFYIVDKVTDS